VTVYKIINGWNMLQGDLQPEQGPYQEDQ